MNLPEEITEELEGKDLKLEDNINKYEEGMKLYKYCKEILENKENKINEILEELS
ncbi:MAG: exodeoxyribonuclease VII small subunit [Tissierellales bacterium]|nr:exodeoxyribonuclease VII small subunit [Tissierellales bacterium]